MGSGWDLHLLPGRSYRPSWETFLNLLAFLRSRLGSAGPTLYHELNSFENEHEVSSDRLEPLVQSALRPGAPTSIWALDNRASDRLFGNPEESPDPEEVFYSDHVWVQVTPVPYPYSDWEVQRARCPACLAPVVSQITSVIGGGRDMAGPVECGCGVATPIHKLKYSWSVPLAQVSIAFVLNQGWQNNLWWVRRVFKDRSFLWSIQRILWRPVSVLAIST